MTVIFLTTGSSSPWTVPSDWNSANNTIEVLGAGGGAGNGQNGVSYPAGGGGGAYSKIANLSLTPSGSVVFQVGAAGTSPATQNTNGVAGGDSWFNGASLGASSVGAKGGGGGVVGVPATGGSGGASGSGVGTTKNSGGQGGPYQRLWVRWRRWFRWATGKRWRWGHWCRWGQLTAAVVVADPAAAAAAPTVLTVQISLGA